jgi:hypothetical protein
MRYPNSVPEKSPGKGWVLIARRQITGGGKIYPTGSEVEIEHLGPNWRALLDAHYCEWRPIADRSSLPKSRDLAPAPPPSGKPEVKIIHDPDALASWRLTKAEMVRACDGNVARAEDLLMANRQAVHIYQVAVRIACTEEAKRRGLRSISPSQVSGL